MLLSVGLGLIMIITAKLIIQKQDVQKEIASLRQKAEEVNRQNEDLSLLLSYLNTDEYKERQAREQLNLKKEGEFVVSLPKDLEESGQQQGSDNDTSMAQKWFDYFFAQ